VGGGSLGNPSDPSEATTPPRAPRTLRRPHTILWLSSPGTEIRIKDRQDPSQSVIEEGASILATDYLRPATRGRCRTVAAIRNPSRGLDSAPDTSPHIIGLAVNATREGNDLNRALKTEIDGLWRLTVGQLRRKHLELFGEVTKHVDD
jgi:hypothetical protein